MHLCYLAVFIFGLGFPSHALLTRNNISVKQSFPNYYSGPITEEEAEEAWGRQAIANDFQTRMKDSSECMVPRWSDFHKPIAQVKAEHPDSDPCCYFGYHGDWLRWPPKTKIAHKFSVNDPMPGRIDDDWGKAVFSDGEEVTMHLWKRDGNVDNDDLYCFANGWLRNQGLNHSLISEDWDTWTHVSRRECHKLNEMYNFEDSELTMWDHVNGWGSTMWRCGCSAGFRGDGCNRVTKREFALHAYHKCILGDHAIGGEIEYCNDRACLLPGNRIGHHKDCGPNFPY